MKKKLLVIAPLVALLISGCTVRTPRKNKSSSEEPSTSQTSGGSNTSSPTSGGTSGGSKTSSPTSGGTSGSGSASGSSGSSSSSQVPPGVQEIGSLENPISLADFVGYADQYIDYDSIDSGKSSTYDGAVFFVKGRVTSSSALNETDEIQFLNMQESTVAVTGHFVLVDSAVTIDCSVANALAGKDVTVKGYACLFHHSSKGKTYQLAKLDNDNKPIVLKAENPAPVPGLNYGTEDKPLTVAQARALLDQEQPSAQPMYVTGVISRNEAYNSQYSNTNIWIKDAGGTDEFELYGCKLPSGFTPAQPAKNDPALVGKAVVATGTGKIFQTTYEFDKNCQIVKFVSSAPESVVITSGSELVVGGTLTLAATVSPAAASQNVTWSIESGSENASLSGNVLTGTHAGTVVVKATATGTTVSTTKSITVSASSETLITSITPSSASVEMTLGDDPVEINITVAPSNYTEAVEWSVTEGSAVSVNNGVITASAVGTATVRVQGAKSHIGADISVTVNPAITPLATVYAAAGTSTDQYTFEGVVVSKTGNSYVIQDGAYGINVYNHAASSSSAALGKIMRVTATVKLQQGCPQTNVVASAVAVGDGVAPAAANVTNRSSLDALNHSVLANVSSAKFVSKSAAWSGSSSVQFIFNIGGDNITVQFDKFGFDAAKGAIANAAVADETYNLTGLYTGAHGGTNQLTFSGTSAIQKVTAEPAGVEITSGATVKVNRTLELAATVLPAGASQAVTWSIESGSENASLSGNVLTGTHAGTVVVKATATGTTVSTLKEITVDHLLVESLSFKESSYSFQGGTIHDMGAEVIFSPNDAEHEFAYSIQETVSSTINATSGSLSVNASDTSFHVVVTDSLSSESAIVAVNVTTEKTLSSISLSGTYPTEFNVNDTFSYTGLVVTAHYSDSTSATVTPTSVSSPDMSSAGPKTVTVSYTESAVTKTATYQITVAASQTEQVFYTLTPSTSGSNNNYNENCDVTVSGIVWNVNGNSQMDPWRFGGKSISGVDRTLYSKTALTDNITKVVMNGLTDGGSITVNSISLVVSTAANGGTTIDTISKTYTKGSSLTFSRPAGHDWTGRYYKFVFNVTVSGSSNKFVSFTSAVFYSMQ